MKAKLMSNLKYLVITSYIVLVAVFGFFYESKNTELKASSPKINFKSINNYYNVDMPRYANVHEQPVIGEQYVNNARVQSSYFITSDTPLDISTFYKKYWDAQGLKTFSKLSPNGGTISVYDYKDKVTKTVVIKQESNNKFRVVLTAVQDSKMKRSFNAFSDIPSYKGSYGFTSYESEDDNYRASNTSYFNSASLVQNEQFYRGSMPNNGWKFIKANTLPAVKITKTLVFRKGHKVAEINLTSNNQMGTIISLMVKDRSVGLIIEGVK